MIQVSHLPRDIKAEPVPMNIFSLDLVIIAVYLIGIAAIGLVYFIMDMKSVGRLFLDDAAPAFGGLITDPKQGLGLPFMIVGPILTVFCVISYVAVSPLGTPPSREQLENTCWGSPLKAITQDRISGLWDPRVIATILCAIMFFLYLIFK